MPGITASKESSSGLYVRGGTPDQNLILYDGFTVYHVDHFTDFLAHSIPMPSRMSSCIREALNPVSEAACQVSLK